MSTTSPAKRRATAFRSNMLDQPMRQTRSMARISDYNDFSELTSTSRVVEQRQATSSSTSSHARNHSPRKARASQAAQLDSLDPDSPDVSMTACMESPKKGRFGDFEFELETSTEVPARRRRIGQSRQASTSPSADVGLPRSKTTVALDRNSTATADNALLTSRKENSPAAPSEQSRPGASPVKPVAALPRASRLHGPTTSIRPSSQQIAAAEASADAKVTNSNRSKSSRPLDGVASELNPPGSSCEAGHRLLFGSSYTKTDASIRHNPFFNSTDSNSLAMLGEPRHSPVKRFQPKTEFIISSPDRPDRKPINLLELKPSPGKAQRGIFRHERADDYEDEGDDDWDASGPNTLDEIRLVKGPAPKRDELVSSNNQPSSSSSSGSVPSAAPFLSTGTEKQSITRSTTNMDVKHTLSSETSVALASLEASLARLKAKTRSPPLATAAASDEGKQGDASASADPVTKRELGTARSYGMTSSRTQFLRAKITMGSESSFSSRSITADQSSDSGIFKRPSGRVSALAKSRGTSSDVGSSLNSSLASSKSMMSFGAPRLPGFSELGARPPVSRPVVTGSRTSSLGPASNDSRAEEEAAQKEEEARVAEVKRQAELKAAKRRSMSSILSSGMPPPPPLHRKEVEASKASTSTATSSLRAPSTRSSSSSSSRSASSSTPAPPSPPSRAEPTEAELAEARKAAKAARRRSLYTYVPTKREDVDGDRSFGNASTGLVVTSSTGGAASDTSTAPPKKQRYLRGLTLLVDVRDQDGEDASACWIDMLKNAGAKVMVRFGERKITHIVYKSGRPSTLHSYRALEEPKPHVVGIGWVVACLEQGQKAEEAPYLVEVAKQAIFATRRRSLMAPKQAPSSANIVRELPKDKLKDVEEARRKLLVHAPAVPSPLRRRVSSRSMLASRLACASLNSPSRADKGTCASGAEATAQGGGDEKEAGEGDDDALLEAYRKRVGSVLSQQSPAMLA
ncbi:hypothetical protein EX895_001226 [Sporisorium graminicola]|uniref:BRCT domain-containing protein n=1 Tax=Sporisorium graminicola TaxID=280036 RepID=A0A4U7L282_9BASI|nr:hypothetical protein EX895_001226 [Sporisorium graminicola]TKY89928.1 hypothetical protein EX895_001226 [Sporisorium graminicola]